MSETIVVRTRYQIQERKRPLVLRLTFGQITKHPSASSVGLT